jgi:hypothetical protein
VPADLFILIERQKTEIVMRVTIIIAKPNMKPILKVSIFLTHASGEKRERTINPMCSDFKFVCFPAIESIVDFRPPIMNAS